MPDPTLTPGATYKFIVRSTEEAVQTIRDRLGENARVLSVRQVGGEGLTGLFSKPKLEVVARVADAQPPASPLVESDSTPPLLRSSEPALPGTLSTPEKPEATLSRIGELRTTATGLNRPGTVADKPTRLPELLRRSGFSETMLGRLQTTPAFTSHEQRPLHHAIAEVGRALRQAAETRKPRPLPARTAFIGTPGVGRTTALCKWLARETFTHQRMGKVIKAEFDRPNPAEGLAVFCEALGLSIEYYAPDQAEGPRTSPSIVSTEGGFLYADLPGLSLRSPEDNSAIADFLNREKFEGRVLVLNAAYDLTALRRAYATGRDLGATHLVFTHLDEIEHWGKLWDFLLEGELTPLFLSAGPSLTGDCDEDPMGAILRRTLPGS